ncbi:MAG: guanine deaminase, partial [Betaproteobacteria bacterium]|nr:guanine deaminase [Betaproteobacteria bacterium]
MTDAPARALALRGAVLHFLRDPALPGTDPAWEYWPDGVVWIEDGRIKAVGDHAAWAPRLPAGRAVHDYGNRLILPGFVDCHVHSAQAEVIASYGTQLLDWLERYTFPAERAFADLDHAQKASAWFLDTLLLNGTTTAAVFPSLHKASVDALFEAAQQRGMRLLGGKVLMDRNAPADLCDGPDHGEHDCRSLIERWHGQGRLSYLLTPRFAPTSSDAQLRMAGELAQSYGLGVQSHVAENRAEVQWVSELFPQSLSYTDVYDHYGLLRHGSIYAHGIWIDDVDREALATHGAALAFCPTSNLFLGSGLFDLRKAVEAGIRVGLASDVGGGTSYSMLTTLAEAYKVLQLRGQSLSPWRGFYLATLAGAHALAQDAHIGNFMPGKEADVVVLDWAVDRVQHHR